MKKTQGKQTDTAKLRRRAEARLIEQTKRTVAPPTTETLVHELQVHQIELEMQNEELVRARGAMEELLRQYTDLYDFAPVGYFTLARDGAIHQVNLGGAKLTGMERSILITRRFGAFLSAQSRITFNAFMNKVLTGEGRETCEVEMLKDGFAPRWLHIEAVAAFEF